MRDDRLDALEIAVGRGFRRGKHIFVVEDVESLVLHGPHVEIRDRDDHEYVEIVFAAERCFVPPHRALERIHGMAAALLLAGLDIDAQRNVAARHGAETVLDTGELAADQSEQIGGLGKRILPDREVATGAGNLARGDEVAIAEQDRRLLSIGLDPGGVDRHDVRSVGEIGDAAEALGFALGAINLPRAIKPHQLGIGGRVEQGLDLQPERMGRSLRDGQPVGSGDVLLGGKPVAVELQGPQHQRIPIEHKGSRRAVAVRFERKRRANPGRGRIKRDIELYGLHQPIGRTIIREADRTGFLGAHVPCVPFAAWRGRYARFHACCGAYTLNWLPALMAFPAAASLVWHAPSKPREDSNA